MGKLARKRIAACASCLSDLPVCQRVKDQIDKDVTESSAMDDDNIRKLLLELKSLKDDDSVNMMKCVKTISALVNNKNNVFPNVVLRTLLRYFMIADARTPLKQAIASNLDGIEACDVRKKTQGIFANFLSEFSHSVIIHASLECGRHAVDLLVTCMSGFALGVEVVQMQIHEVLIFLRWFLEILMSNCHQSRNEGQSENDISTTLKCISLILKKCTDSKKLDNADQEILEILLVISKNVLRTATFGWDCHNAAGIAWVAIWKVLHDDENLLRKIADTINEFTTVQNDMSSDKLHCIAEALPLSFGLSFCNGVLVTLSNDALAKSIDLDEDEKCLLLHYILPYLRTADRRCKTISNQVIVMKSFVKWTSLLLEACKVQATTFIKRSLRCDTKDEDLIHYAVDKLEHPTDSIRHQANEMLINLLGIGTSLGVEGYAESLVKNIVSQSWQKRSTFIALNCILHYISPEVVMKDKPDITFKLLEAIQHQSLAPYASETYKIIASKTREERNTVLQQNDAVFETFIDPMLMVMCRSNAHSLRLLIDYCFIKTLKVYGTDCVMYIFNSFKSKLLSDVEETSFHQILAAFLACFRTTVMNGYMRDKDTVMQDGSCRNLFLSALVHEDNEIRHLGFALLCESIKPSNLISFETLDALKYALPFNISCQDPAFRQRLLNSLKKLFLQLKGNMGNLSRMQRREMLNGQIDPEAGNLLIAYWDFIIWLSKFVAGQLYSSAPYPKRITCISILTEIVKIFIGDDTQIAYKFALAFTSQAVQSLFLLLSDPYEDVKKLSFMLLTNDYLKDFVSSFMSSKRKENMLTRALERACKCSKPEWCGDASYHIKLYAALKENQPRHQVASGICSELLKLLNESIKLATKSLYLAATTSPMYGLLHCLKSLLQSVDFREMDTENIFQWRKLVADVIVACFLVSDVVLPVVGSVSPEGHLPDVESPLTDEVDGGADDAWNKLPDAVKSIVLGKSEVDAQDERKTRALAQQVLICCWRSAKESSLLLEEIASIRFPLDSSESLADGVLSWNQLLEIGEHLRKQLMEARHRGAFEIAYYAFKAYCPRIWKTEHQDLKSVSEKWLLSALTDITDPSRSKEICATRRSAGLPFLMQALLSDNKSAKGKRHLHHVMTTLLSLCSISEATGLVPKIHSLNVIRGLVKDASLGEEVLPYVSECMQVSLTGFNSSIWAIRNSSTLLFSALFTRIFGVKRDKNDDLCMKNRLSGNEFFSRLPGLHSFLLEQLERICESLDKGGHHSLSPTLHPILLLLSRIYPSPLQSTASVCLDDYVPLLLRCRSCAVYKSRVATAAATASILAWDQRLTVLRICCENLSTDVAVLQAKISDELGVTSSPQNRIHGGLLQIKEVILCCTRETERSTKMSAIASAVSSTFHRVLPFLSSKMNNCPLTRATSLEVFLLIYPLITSGLEAGADDHWNKLIENVMISAISELEDSSGTMHHQPGYTFLVTECAKVGILLSKRSSVLLSFLEKSLNARNVDVTSSVLDALLGNWNEMESKLSLDDAKLLESQLVINAMSRETYSDAIASTVYLLLSKIASSLSVERLLGFSMKTALRCKAAQSSLLQAIIKFQSSCMNHMISTQGISSVPGVVASWVNVLSSASRCYENTDDVRYAVADSLLENVSLLVNDGGLLGSKVVQLWVVLIDLLCDEESDVRKMACYVVNKAMKKIGNETLHQDHPCVDTLASIYAIVTLILTHGRRHREECRRALQSLAESESVTVPISTEASSSDDKAAVEDFLPGLFERSETNTYLDEKQLFKAAKFGLDILNDIEEKDWKPKLLMEKFDPSKI